LRWVERDRYPRFWFTVSIGMAAVGALLSSWVLLQLGVRGMWWRFPIAMVFGYAVLVLMLWLWLRRKEDIPDLGSLPSGLGGDGNGAECVGEIPGVSPGGGRFGGGGATDSFGVTGKAAETKAAGGVHVAEALGAVGGEGCLVVSLLGAVVLVAALAGGVMAPAFFSELVVDAAVLSLLYRRVGQAEGPYFLHAIWRTTRAGFAVMVILASVAGWLAHLYAPQAVTLGEALIFAFGKAIN